MKEGSGPLISSGKTGEQRKELSGRTGSFKERARDSQSKREETKPKGVGSDLVCR